MAGAKPRCRGERQEVRGDGVRLLQDNAVCVRAPAAQQEGKPPEGASIAHLVAQGGRVAACLVGTGRPQEGTLPALDVEEVGDIPH
eukprot:5757382-Pleurochrysis_carterae.AAC.1